MMIEKLLDYAKNHGTVFGPWYTLKYEDGKYKFGWRGGLFETQKITPFFKDLIEYVIIDKKTDALSWLLGDEYTVNRNVISFGRLDRKPVYLRVGNGLVFRDFVKNSWAISDNVFVIKVGGGFVAIQKWELKGYANAVPLVKNQKNIIRILRKNDFDGAIRATFPWLGEDEYLKFKASESEIIYEYRDGWKKIVSIALLKKNSIAFNWVPMRNGFYRVYVPFDYEGINPLKNRVKNGDVTYELLEEKDFSKVDKIEASFVLFSTWTAYAGENKIKYDELSGYRWSITVDGKVRSREINEGTAEAILSILDKSKYYFDFV